MCSAASGPAFQAALAAALEAGKRELTSLKSLADDVQSSYLLAGEPAIPGEGADDLLHEFVAMRRRFSDGLAGHLKEQADVLSAFNIVFFGRTGAGKSTLLSAFGELDGTAVSQGESDWTKNVQTIVWEGCRFYDTPGINGWGGRDSRENLEARARKAVETADVVLLCFDTQSQQASEFAKVADWVTHFGKPVIAVLNVRNPRWRHPARVVAQTARRHMSEAVAQHAENIRAELVNIGLHDVPVVALSSQRALFARAATPYRGPHQQNFADDRTRYGTDYLARWSNFTALEAVLTACIAAGGAQLRLKSLREGVRALLTDEATALEQLRARLVERAEELDRLIRLHLEVLGYLEPEQRATYLASGKSGSDLLSAAEAARGAPYRSPVDGSLVRQVRNLLKPHLAESRNNTLRRFKELERKAFRERAAIDPEAFVAQVFVDAEISSALDRVSAEAAGFLKRELSLAGIELRGPRSAQYGKAGLEGDAGETAELFGDILRYGSLAGKAIGAAVIIASPVGWAAAAAGIGIGLASEGVSLLGKSVTRDAARAKAEARAKAAREGRKLINDYFDTVETDFTKHTYGAAWKAAAPSLRPAVAEFINLTALRADLDSVVAQLHTEAASIAATESLGLLDVAAGVLTQTEGRGPQSRVEEILLGDDWFDHVSAHQDIIATEDFEAICRQRPEFDTATLQSALNEAFQHPPRIAVDAWAQNVSDAAELDDAFVTVIDALAARRKPAVVVAGDYSAGKSSFIKRMIAEFGGRTPDSLHLRADATTDEIRRYSLNAVEIIDTPGFQSSRAGHDELALAGVRQAALVIVVLHVNLLIGDTSALQQIAHGTPTAAGKWPRMLFVVNRCDELGADPVDAPDEYFNRRDRKCAELDAALKSRQIEVSLPHIHGVAADPFGAVGTRVPVAADDYTANRAWDGIQALADALGTWASTDLAQAATLVALDDAVTEVLTLGESTRTSIAAYRVETEKHQALIAAMSICLDDAAYLRQSLEHELSDALSGLVAKAIAGIREIERGDANGLAEAKRSWLTDPETDSLVERVMNTATVKVNDWSTTHQSAISREEAAAGFDAALNLPGGLAPGAGADGFGRVFGVAGKVAAVGGQFGKALGKRDAALAIGHFFGHKFKPWGAIKAGTKIGRVGAVLGVVAVVVDVAAEVNDSNRTKNWDARRDEAAEQVEADRDEAIRALMAEPTSPWSYLSQRSEQVRELQQQYLDRQRAAAEQRDRLELRLATAENLVATAERLRKAAVHE